MLPVRGAANRLGSDSIPLTSSRLAAPLEAACPGHLSRKTPYGGGAKEWTCAACPEEVKEPLGSWTLSAAYLGHFISPQSEDAILSIDGCLPHVAGPPGDALLMSRKAGKWKKVTYAMTLQTYECRKIRMSDRRDGLLCAGGDGHQGSGAEWFQSIVERGGNLEYSRFLVLQGNTTACSMEQTIDQRADAIDLRRTATSKYDLRINVSSGSEKRSEAEDRRCHEGHDLTVRTTRYRLLFHFDGHVFQPTPNTAKAIKQIESIQRPDLL